MTTCYHNGSNCCGFCKIEKNVTQYIRRIAYGRPEPKSTRNLITQRAYGITKRTVEKW